MYRDHKVSAIVTCSGKGTRFGSNKLLVELGGITILERTVRAMLVPAVDELIVTISSENEEVYRRILIDDAALPVSLVPGGAERHISAMNGLEATTGDIVVVHDGVRPFVTEDLIMKVIDSAIDHGSAMLGMPSTVQVKLVDDEGFIQGSLDREHSWLGQTPQAFRRDLLRASYESAVADRYQRVSDDADLVHEYTSTRARILPGHVNNIKITTPQDLGTARLIIEENDRT
ncbi:2-C-methyl-D-erythritol 4-phosphate cytidylyltransferase [Microbacterium esteraromaticum]|uniref:2-C-methyl-D-erythritol 4-phosphate cytidylyltransferase n=1 Tax=Microbacterium esteraromaticum TaxID=57043 RepID=A0A1R4JEM8_9MICO|nr:IspD/TarI family cytidylyltransferase [Microbacterium esteraromaticum]SJN30487.1 2-C-methyl-D-erythritol 4-phosphate cytidylyltransferase [Microbacterium esteraromaticum]